MNSSWPDSLTTWLSLRTDKPLLLLPLLLLRLPLLPPAPLLFPAPQLPRRGCRESCRSPRQSGLRKDYFRQDSAPSSVNVCTSPIRRTAVIQLATPQPRMLQSFTPTNQPTNQPPSPHSRTLDPTLCVCSFVFLFFRFLFLLCICLFFCLFTLLM